MSENGPLWEALNDIRERIARMETSLASYTGQISERCERRADRLKSVEARLAELEKRVWLMIGAASVISSLSTAVLTVLMQHMGV
ncbi:MAG: hemolysin XhlA family protein [Bacteroidales bacterium]|nr:hemolysin XhlA family protein [Bacteroidales bacterium]